jgi:hypothetical protein
VANYRLDLQEPNSLECLQTDLVPTSKRMLTYGLLGR